MILKNYNNMLTFSDFARQYWPNGLNDVSYASFKLNEWLHSLDYEFISELDDDESFTLSNFSKSFINVNAFEFERMACASLESHLALDLSLKGKKNLAWTIIKLYYSAYYAAHAIMRSMGRFCVHLDSPATSAVLRNAKIFFPNSLRPKNGNYLVKYNADINSIDFIRSNTPGGAHMFFWEEFKALIGYLMDELGNKSTAYQRILLSLSDLKDCLSKDGNNMGNWLSVVRNDITYQHKYGVWYPHKNYNRGDGYKVFQTFQLNINPLMINLISTNSILHQFGSITNYIIVLMVEIGNELIKRNSINRSFLNRSFRYLLRKLYQNLHSRK